MIFYITRDCWHSTIRTAIEESGEMVDGHEVGDEIYFNKIIQGQSNRIEHCEKLIVDLSSLVDTEDEILDALTNFKFINDRARIIIIDPGRIPGDPLLAKIYNTQINNFITTDDQVEMKALLKTYLLRDMTFKESLPYKKASEDAGRTITTYQNRKSVEKVLVVVAGVNAGVGCTHNAIVLANFLRAQKFRVALVEMNSSGAFNEIQSYDGDEWMGAEGNYFQKEGVDYYPSCSLEKDLHQIIGQSYNFVVVDLGNYFRSDRITFSKGEIRILITGGKVWDYRDLNRFFDENHPEEYVKNIHYCFNLAPKEERERIREGMGDRIPYIHFVECELNPFLSSHFVDGMEIFQEYLPEKEAEEKKSKFPGFFSKKKKS